MNTQAAKVLFRAISSRSDLSERETEKPQPEENGENTSVQETQPPQRISIAFVDDLNVRKIEIQIIEISGN